MQGAVPIYRSYRAGNSPAAGNYRLVTDLTLHVRMAGSSTLQGVVMCSPFSSAQIDADITRLLEQAPWGRHEALVTQVRQRGVTAQVDKQLALPSTRYSATSSSSPIRRSATFSPC